MRVPSTTPVAETKSYLHASIFGLAFKDREMETRYLIEMDRKRARPALRVACAFIIGLCICCIAIYGFEAANPEARPGIRGSVCAVVSLVFIFVSVACATKVEWFSAESLALAGATLSFVLRILADPKRAHWCVTGKWPAPGVYAGVLEDESILVLSLIIIYVVTFLYFDVRVSRSWLFLATTIVAYAGLSPLGLHEHGDVDVDFATRAALLGAAGALTWYGMSATGPSSTLLRIAHPGVFHTLA